MYNIVLTDYFKKQLKRLLKKDRTLKENLKNALYNFAKETSIFICSDVYKIRIKGLGKGKSGGYRAYLLVMEFKNLLTPICIYAKNEKESLTNKELALHLEITKLTLENLLRSP